MGQRPEDGEECEREEDEEYAKRKEGPRFLEFLPPEQTFRSKLGNQQNLGTHRSLALDFWDTYSWLMVHQARVSYL